jgi:hypothetical protein
MSIRTLLYAALDVVYIAPEQFKINYDQAGKTKALISAFKAAMPKKY